MSLFEYVAFLHLPPGFIFSIFASCSDSRSFCQWYFLNEWFPILWMPGGSFQLESMKSQDFVQKNDENLHLLESWLTVCRPNSNNSTKIIADETHLCAPSVGSNRNRRDVDGVPMEIVFLFSFLCHGKPLNCMTKRYCPNSERTHNIMWLKGTHSTSLSNAVSPSAVNTCIAQKKKKFWAAFVWRGDFYP